MSTACILATTNYAISASDSIVVKKCKITCDRNKTFKHKPLNIVGCYTGFLSLSGRWIDEIILELLNTAPSNSSFTDCAEHVRRELENSYSTASEEDQEHYILLSGREHVTQGGFIIRKVYAEPASKGARLMWKVSEEPDFQAIGEFAPYQILQEWRRNASTFDGKGAIEAEVEVRVWIDDAINRCGPHSTCPGILSCRGPVNVNHTD